MAIIQRFGSALNLNVHVHALVLDGVYAEDGAGGLIFHPAAPATDDEMDQVLAIIGRRMFEQEMRRPIRRAVPQMQENLAGGGQPDPVLRDGRP